MSDFEDQLGGSFLQPAATTDRHRLVVPIMRRIEAEDRRRSVALGASAVIGTALALSAVAAAGAAPPARSLVTELWRLAANVTVSPQLGVWALIPLAAAGLALSALAATRAAQQL